MGIGRKERKRGALLADPFEWWETYVVQNQIATLGIRTKHVLALKRLPDVHKDPFDRILAAQSIVEKVPLVSKDSALKQYGVSVIW